MSQIKRKVFGNGFKVSVFEMPYSQSVAATLFIKTGSRNEPESLLGISHFLEHMPFKGTLKRPTAKQVAESAEGKGGQLNAWTDVNHTAFYDKLPSKYWQEGLDLVFDLAFQPLLKPEDIEMEKGVIVEEINRYNDIPAAKVWELFQKVMWPNHPLGKSPLGTKQTVLALKQEDFLAYHGFYYQPQNAVLSVAGNIEAEQIFSQAEQILKVLKTTESKFSLPPQDSTQLELGSVLLETKEVDQTHLVLGIYGVPLDSPDYFTLLVLSGILGKGMSSRLFIKIREEKGWAYSISSESRSFEDDGYLAIAGGIKNSKVKEALKIIIEELKTLTKKKVDKKELERTKEYLSGNFLISMDDPDNVSSFIGSQELLAKITYSPQQFVEQISKIKAADVLDLAQRLFKTGRIRLALIGPFKNSEEFAKILQL